MTLSFVPLGVGDAFSRRYYSSCLAVWADEGGPILVDCPHPIRKILADASSDTMALDLGDIQWVVLTHLHADHVSGLEGYLFFSRFHLGRRGKIAASGEVLRRLWPDSLAAGMDTLEIEGEKRRMSLADFADCTELSEERPRRVGPFTIACRKTSHHVPTFALRISVGDACLAYSADTSFDPTLIDWLAQGDLIVHETNEGIHTPYHELAALPEPLRKKMRLIHYPDDFDLENSRITPLVQGRVYTI
jgi:ribonuclease BN (tRNA processing enzyme)